MKITESEKPLQLRELIVAIEVMNRDEWVYVDSKVIELSEETTCYRIQINDFSDEEIDQYEEEEKKTFLNKDQLEDILTNLSQQKKDTNLEEKIEAISYFWSSDAFIEI